MNLFSLLACPYDGLPLSDTLTCEGGHQFPVVEGIPVLLRDDVPPTMEILRASLNYAREGNGAPYYLQSVGLTDSERDAIAATPQGGPVDPVVSHLIGATSGNLYNSLKGKLKEYPIPNLRLPESNGKLLLDVGCNWGRWTMAAARKGYQAIGIDPSLGAVLAARRVCRQLGLEAQFVVGDARYLPFRTDVIDTAFSYSVLQHFSKSDARMALREIGRVLCPGGQSLVQMPNAYGVRCLITQARRGFKEVTGFDVRYWKPRELVAAFTEDIGTSSLSVDGFFGLGIQPTDTHLLPWPQRMVVQASETLRKTGRGRRLADSLYLKSTKNIQG